MEERMDRQGQAPDQQAHGSEVLLDRLAGSWLAQAITVAAKLGIADLIRDEPRACSELAQATEADPGARFIASCVRWPASASLPKQNLVVFA